MTFRVCLLTIFFLSASALSFAADSHPVCSVADFRTFIEQFSALSKDGQAMCIRYPVDKNEGEPYQDRASLESRFPNRKFVLSDIEGEERSTPFFSPGDFQSIQAGKMGYIYQESSDGTNLILVRGHETFVYELLNFEYINNQWMLTGVYNPEDD